ncbi:hypothetical protein RND71_016673 [Anisodus tanguticus]|uniref:Uncharacterized protein n=1 Tax=Anisodus tanguticus TaxID=243964 RepID=A0AAE1S8R8_9SOLA|nr:hypothetical protein RND71_016673 [Anisodus tanguticus]
MKCSGLPSQKTHPNGRYSSLTRKAFVLISSPIAKELVDEIEMDSSVVSRICTLEEMNLEFFPIDSQGFITDNERPLKELYGDKKAFRHLIRKKLAAGVWNSLNKYKSTLPDFPQTETCELLIVDRSVERIVPIMHDLTYDAMCHELLNMHENKYVHEVPGKAGGPPEKEDDLLKDHDPIWLRRRITLSQRIKQHKCVKKLIFGDAEAAELIKFLKVYQHVKPENRLRLLMIYAVIYPEKFEIEKDKLMELARLPEDDMNVVYNMILLEGSTDNKSSLGPFYLIFDFYKKKRVGEAANLSRFYPMIEKLIEKLSKTELPKNDYPCMNDSSPTLHGTS